MGRAGTIYDVARAVKFLALEFDGFITGTTLDINGGVYAVEFPKVYNSDMATGVKNKYDKMLEEGH